MQEETLRVQDVQQLYAQYLSDLLKMTDGRKAASEDGNSAEERAARVIRRCPFITDLCEKHPYDLMIDCRLTEKDAMALSVLGELMPRVMRSEDLKKPLSLREKDRILPYLGRLFLCERMPCIYLLAFGSDKKLLTEMKIHEGIPAPTKYDINCTMLDLRDRGAASVLLAQYTAGSKHVGWEQWHPYVKRMKAHKLDVFGVYQVFPDEKICRRALPVEHWELMI